MQDIAPRKRGQWRSGERVVQMGGTGGRVYNFLRNEIEAGNLKAGAHLREAEIAGNLATSRTPVREALRQLEAEGLAVVTRNVGATVRAYSLDDAREIFWMRSQLEGRAAARAALRMTTAEIADLDRLCDAMEADARYDPIDLVSFGAANARFHLSIADASGSEVLATQIRHLVRIPIVLFRGAQWERELPAAAGFRQHRELVRAIAARNPDWAKAQMSAHILSASPGERRSIETTSALSA